MPAASQQDVATRHGGRVSRRTVGAMGAGAARGKAVVCGDPPAWVCRQLRLTDEISGAVAGGRQCGGERFTTEGSHAPRCGAAYLAAGSGGPDEQAKPEVE